MDLLFSIFELLTVAAGPFCVFAGMGKDKNVGKLTFRNIIAADNSIEITENSSCITLTSKSSNVAVPLRKIPWGCDTGITWGFLEADTDNQSITGLNMIGIDNPNFSGSTASGNNIIISPSSNIIKGKSSENNIIVNSVSSCMYNEYGRRNAIIGGKSNLSCASDQSSIIESKGSCNGYGIHSTIISSYNSKNCQTQKSTIISSSKSAICYNGGNAACNDSIISSLCSCSKNNNTSTIISSNCVCLKNGNALSQTSTSNSIISSFISVISGGQTSGGITLGSKLSSIIGDCKSQMCDTFGSTIMSGCTNYICTYTIGGGNLTGANNCYNSILAGGQNRIYQVEDPSTTGDIIFNSILSSCAGRMYTSKYSSIVSSINNTLIDNSCFSTIIGGKRISQARNSSVLNSSSSDTSYAGWSSNIGGQKNTISEGSYNVNLSGTCNTIRSQSYNSVILAGQYNTHCASRNSVIFAGNCNQIISSTNGTILGGRQNLLKSVCGSSILAGFCNCIDGSTYTYTSGVILGGCDNCIISRQSIIVGGTNNSIVYDRNFSAVIATTNGYVGYDKSVIVASCSKNSTAGNQVTVTNLIFDKHVYVGPEPIVYCGRTANISLPSTFKIRLGFITTS